MNLDAFWQTHRRFLTGTAIGLVVFLIAKAIIGSTVRSELDGAERRIRAYTTSLRTPSYGAGEVSRLESRLRDVQERISALAVQTLPPLPEEYRPRAGQSPSQHYIEWTGQRRQELISSALLQDVSVDESLGLPPVSPTQPQVIERVLRGFFVVDEVIHLAISVGAREVDDMEIATRASARRGARRRDGPVEVTLVTMEVVLEDARVAPFVQALAHHDPPLGLTRVEILPFDAKRKQRSVLLEFGAGAVPRSVETEELP